MFPCNDKLLPIMEKDTQELFVVGLRNLFEETNRERQRDSKRKITWSEIANKIGVTSGNLSGFLNYSRNYSESKRSELANFFGKSYIEVLDLGRSLIPNDKKITFAFDKTKILEALFTLHGNPPQMTPDNLQDEDKREYFESLLKMTAPPVVNFQDKADKRHAAVIAEFEDKEKAVEINEKLVELEKLDGTDGLKAASTYIDFLINQAREKKGLPPLKNGTNPNQ